MMDRFSVEKKLANTVTVRVNLIVPYFFLQHQRVRVLQKNRCHVFRKQSIPVDGQKTDERTNTLVCRIVVERNGS
jgi:hypothetical protein